MQSALLRLEYLLRLINPEPAMLEKFSLPVSRFPGLEKHDLEHRSLYEVMLSTRLLPAGPSKAWKR